MRLYCKIILWDYVPESYYGIILRNHITEWHYATILRNHLYEKDPGDTRDVPGASLDPRDPLGTLLGPPGTPLRTLGTPLEPPGTPLGPQARPWDHPGTPLGPQWTPMENKNNKISTNIQRQKLSIAVFKPACQGPSHETFSRADFYIKSMPKSKKLPPGTRMSVRCVLLSRKPHLLVIY